MTFPHRTLRNSVRLDGFGLHSGAAVTVTIHPGRGGIYFRSGAERVEARPENVTDTTRCTRLGGISTVEHVMSAFAGLGITDAEVELSSPELPAMDGSASALVGAILTTGTEDTGTFELAPPFSRVFLQEGEIKIAVGKGDGHWRFEYDAGTRWPGAMTFELPTTVEGYANEVAPARTFALMEELPPIFMAGLAKGLDQDSALVLGIEGYKNTPRFPDEPARHKLLDLIGDLYLSGVPIAALNVVATRSGHRTHVKAAALLAQAVRPV